MFGRFLAAALLAMSAAATGCTPDRPAEPPWREALDKGRVIRLGPPLEKAAVVAVSSHHALAPAPDAGFLQAPSRPQAAKPRSN